MQKYILRDNIYYLGPNHNYCLTKKALNHIIDGDFTERLTEVSGKRTGNKELVLKGGLHTYQGWIKFKKFIPNIAHLRFYNSNKHKFWYFARELQNGVITLKLPVEIFQSKAANLTKFPETYYKSGYLWKTLFPKNKTKNDILNIINESLYNLDKSESQAKILIGYALLDDPFKTIKIRIQCECNEINSAFPTWEQPMTGNNGKAYSHADTISFIIASSTEFFDDENYLIESNIYGSNFELNSLIANTPYFFLKRPTYPNIENIKKWNLSRNKELKRIAKKINSTGITKLKNYLQDSFICKEGYFFQQDAYNQIYIDFSNNKVLFNAISINKNILEALSIINYFDNKNKSTHLIEVITHLLLNKIIYTGALDNWNNKILHNKILDFILEYHDEKIIPIYLNLLSNSPTRYSLYLEFDLANICFKKNFNLLDKKEGGLFSVMNLPIDNYTIKSVYFKDYLLLNLSENYYLCFNESFRDKQIDKIIYDFGENFTKFVEDVMRTTETKDFYFFSDKFDLLTKKIILSNIQDIDIKSFSLIIKDYFRIQTAQRMKIFLRKQDFELNAMEYFDYNSQDFKLHTLIKHERRINVFCLEDFLDNSFKLAEYLQDENLKLQINQYRDKVWTERPPLPKPIPIPNKFN